MTQLPLYDEDEKTAPPQVARNSCRHAWTLKDDQSSLPRQGQKPDSSTVYNVAAYCIECRSHLDLCLDFRGGGNEFVSCPNKPWLLHHFIHKSEISQNRHIVNSAISLGKENAWVDIQRFQCSSPNCSAKLSIRFEPPRLIAEWVSLLTDLGSIKQRAKKAIAEDPDRFEGHAIPHPTTVLSTLRQYIINAMGGDSRKIPGNNKKWLLCLGEPCFDLLQYLGFESDGQDWLPPQPQPETIIPIETHLRILLDDVEKELLVLISKRPAAEKRAGSLQYVPISAMDDIMRALGCMKYQQSLQPRNVDSSRKESPFYAGLGATCDFHDNLITFAYQRQVEIDPVNIPYYLECLQEISEDRRSEVLQTVAAIEASSDKISLKDVRSAYKEIGLEFPSTLFDDDTIIGTFQSRISDAPRQEAELRRALKIIGHHRSSEKIQQIASNVVSNYGQAISWLGATEDIDDAFLLSLYCTKVSENPADESIANQAVKIIAQHRNSSALKAWIATGVLGETDMDVAHAYNRLEIPDRTIDDETILSAYNLHVSEAPSQTNDLRNALTAIAKSRNSKLLQNFLNSGMASSEYPPSEWPVGLENIGNTCYLNSLLQFYFTVKPLRDLVLNFDQHKMEIEGESLTNKRVGSRKVSRKEVERAQRFVYELQKLFQSMISASNAQVTPEQELARLTLMSSTTEEHIRRQSILSGHRPSLGEINGRPVFGPLPPHAVEHDAEMTDTAKPETNHKEETGNDNDADNSSDATLVEAPAAEDDDLIMLDQQQQLFEDKENLPPNKTVSVRSNTPETHLQPLGESSPSRTNEQQKLPDTGKDAAQNLEETALTPNAPPPSRPPPFPPRPKPEEHIITTLDEVEIGAQQDVTEVIANVLFQLQCAVKAEFLDESGEQIDQIKKLFFGKQKSYTTNNQGLIRTKEEFISDIKVDVASGPRDIYAALDGAYDVQQVEVGGALEPQYTTISQLPPVLQVHVQRAQFDPEKKSSFKSDHHLELKETIYMDRYMDTHDEDLMQRRWECWKWKKDLIRLEARKKELTKSDSNMDMSELLASTANYLRQLVEGTAQDEDPIEVSDSLLQDIEAASADVKKELEGIDSRIKSLTTNIQSQFSDLRTIPYRLHSVFIHRGYVSSGHYWIYIYDFVQKMWRKYNDGYVTEVKDTTEIFEQDSETRPATPYFLVYIRDEWKDQLVDPVCRDIVEAPHESPDAEMIDISDDSQDQPEPIELDSFPTDTDADHATIDIGVAPGWDAGRVTRSSNW